MLLAIASISKKHCLTTVFKYYSCNIRTCSKSLTSSILASRMLHCAYKTSLYKYAYKLSTKKLIWFRNCIACLKFTLVEIDFRALILTAQIFYKSSYVLLIGNRNLKRVLYFSTTSGENTKCKGQ